MNQKDEYAAELEAELREILGYWITNTIDPRGGFFGRIDQNNIADLDAPKGAVLNARILWTFSAAFRHGRNPSYLQTASLAYDYIVRHFIDHENGGVYWTVDAAGNPLETKKQIYAQAFMVYAMAEYFRATETAQSLQIAIAIYKLIQRYGYDKVHGGYIEAFSLDWKPADDMRLSAKDVNGQKTMNTHLHLLEAFTTLHKIWPDGNLKAHISELIHIFRQHMIDETTGHLLLFFDEQWQLKPGPVSYGHDIEAAWLLAEATAVIGDARLIEKVQAASLKLADAAAEAIDQDGGLWYEREAGSGELVRQKHWWPQAEAMVGFYALYEQTGDDKFFRLSRANWTFVRTRLKDNRFGEWFWGIDASGRPMPGEDKAGLWKCPYHNGRACLELLRRLRE